MWSGAADPQLVQGMNFDGSGDFAPEAEKLSTKLIQEKRSRFTNRLFCEAVSRICF